MSRHIGTVASNSTVTQMPPIGGVAAVFRSGDAFKAVGEVVSRAAYPALDAAFPRNGSFASETITLSPSRSILGCAYGNGVFVAVGPYVSGETLAYCAVSQDGRAWTVAQMTGINKQWNCVVFYNGMFIAGAADGSISTSPDGYNWTARASNTTNSITGFAYGGGILVAITQIVGGNGYTNVALSSPDGITWATRTMPSSSAWAAVAYGAGKFVAICISSTTAATSTDGITWAARTLPATTIGSYPGLAFANGIFVAGLGVAGVGSYLTSADGVSWTQRTIPDVNNQFGRILFGNGVFIALAGNGTTNRVFTSQDGVSWKVRTAPITMAGGACGVYGAGIFATFSGTSGALLFAETDAGAATPSDMLYLSGTAGQFVRVK